LLLFGFFGVSLFGIEVSALSAAAFGVIAYGGAYMAENIRGGIEAIRKQQWEAGAALGLTQYQQLRIVILPQALRIIIPPSVGFFVGLIKDTAVATIVGFVELTHAAVIIRYRIGESFTVFAAVMAIYFVLCYPIATFGRYLERRLQAGVRAWN
jgi:polar amino acid transport system permease protein